MSGRPWTPAEDDIIEELTARHLTDQAIGRRLGRSATAVHVRRKRQRIPSRRATVLSARSVADQLGLSCPKRVGRWIEQGWLRGRRGQPAGASRQWVVPEEALLEFLQDARYWHVWRVDEIPERALREWAAEVRSGVRYLTTGMVGERVGVNPATVQTWIAAGLLPAVRRANWLVRESDLAGFVPPCERPRAGMALREWTPEEDGQLLAGRASGATFAALAARNRAVDGLRFEPLVPVATTRRGGRMSGPAVWHDDGQCRLYLGDCREVMRGIDAESVDCVVTSPPYWSLRDYQIAPSVWDGDADHIHDWEGAEAAGERYTGKRKWQHGATRESDPDAWRRAGQSSGLDGGKTTQLVEAESSRRDCGGGNFCDCGAWRGALGLEPTPALFIAHVVDVMREVRRVLKPTGTAWVNMGDSFASGGRASYDEDDKSKGRGGSFRPGSGRADGIVDERAQRNRNGTPVPPGLKAKDKCLIPHRLGIALQEDGWWVRMDVIWAKPNPMPESVTDRPTQAHEFVWFLTKSERYWYDADAIREPNTAGSIARFDGGKPRRGAVKYMGMEGVSLAAMEANEWVDGRNKRSVWSIPTSPFPEAHFATFPPALVKPCILAGCPPGGVVLDPFVGSGTTAMVAKQLGRKAIGIDMSPEYLAMAVRRCVQMGLMFDTEGSL